MCTFITLIAANDDLDRINAILASLDNRGHVRRAERVETPGLRACLAPQEREYWLSRGTCDCGTYLGHEFQRGENPEEARAAAISRYRRKGWSEARIARALADKARAEARPARRQPNEDAAYWSHLMNALAEGLGLQRLGLMHHFYRTSPGQEPESATRTEGGHIAHAGDVLGRMQDGVIHDFLFPGAQE